MGDCDSNQVLCAISPYKSTMKMTLLSQLRTAGL